jgi:WD40 repeat protein
MAQPKAKPPFTSGPYKQIGLLEHDRELALARFSPCGRFVVAGSYDGKVYRWTLETNEKVALEGHNGWLQGLAFHPDGKRMFTADSWGGVIAWNLADAAPKPLWTKRDAHARWMRSLAIDQEGKRLATCGADRFVRTWTTDGKLLSEKQLLEDLFTVLFHPKDPALLVGDLKGQITQLHADDLKEIRRLDASILYARPKVNGFTEINDVGGVRAMAFDAAGTVLAATGSQPATSGFFTGKPTAVLFDFVAGKQSQVLQWEGVAPEDGVAMDVSASPDGAFLLASSGQPGGKGAFYVWKPGEAKPLHLDKNLHHCRTVSPHGNRLALTQTLVKPGQSAGNGRHLTKDGEYVGLVSQVRILERA